MNDQEKEKDEVVAQKEKGYEIKKWKKEKEK